VFAPQEGKALTTSYLSAALKVLGPSLRYVSQWHHQSSAVLEFEADLDGVYVQGVDMLRWNAEGKLVSFTVMVRPLRGLQKLIELMAFQLGAGQT
jgi:hypothetical protein